MVTDIEYAKNVSVLLLLLWKCSKKDEIDTFIINVSSPAKIDMNPLDEVLLLIINNNFIISQLKHISTMKNSTNDEDVDFSYGINMVIE